MILSELIKYHSVYNSIKWRLTPVGIQIEGDPTAYGTPGDPVTARRFWYNYKDICTKWADFYGVPVELVIATALTESSGKPDTIRLEPGYLSDDRTPDKISPGLMQTLISTAQFTLKDKSINRHWLLVPENSIQAGTAYITFQYNKTKFDPPKVACAYNSGGVYHQDSPSNRWKMRQYPIGTSKHCDRFVLWFNDVFRVFDEIDDVPENSFYSKF